MNKQHPTEDLFFTLPLDFSEELPERFTSTSIIGGKCSSVWDCGDQVIVFSVVFQFCFQQV